MKSKTMKTLRTKIQKKGNGALVNLVSEISRLKKQAGFSTKDLLKGLDEQRKRLYKERYQRTHRS